MTNVHCKLLVLISKYGQMPVADEPETWIRELPLLVLVYEGITAGVFEMDYSPQCMTMSHTGVTRSMFLSTHVAPRSHPHLRALSLSVSPYLSDTLHPSPFTSHSSLPLARPSSLPPPALPPSVSLTLSQASLYQCAHIHKKPVRVSILTRAR